MKYLKFSTDKLIEECNFKDDLTAKKYGESNRTLKTICSDNVNKLSFAHLNISSIKNKFEFLAMQVKCKIDILIIFNYILMNVFQQGIF